HTSCHSHDLLSFPTRRSSDLLQGYGRACAFQSFLGSVCGSLVNAFQNSLWCSVNQVFCVFQTQGGQSAYFLDDTDLGIARGFEDNVKFGLLFFSSCVVATGWGACSNCNWSCSGYVEFFFASLDEFGQFEQGRFLELIQQFFS